VTGAQLLPLVVAVPLVGAAVLVAAGRRLSRLAADVTGCAFASGGAALALAALVRAGHGWEVEEAGEWRRAGVVLVADRLGLGTAVLVSLLVVAVLAYSWRYFDEPMPRHAGSFPAIILVFQAGMCGFALTGDLFNAFVFFELMGVVAYALTGYRVEEPRPVQGALTFGLLNSLGGYCTLLGIALLYARTGELGMARIGHRLDGGGPDALVLAAFVLVMTGLLVKAAAVPFHFWLPDAHAVAPTPVCMLLSGVMVELGTYGVARVYWTVFAGPGGLPHEAFQRTLLVLGTVTAVAGAAMCWAQRHLKRLLAFSTVAHVGLFLVGVAALSPDGVAGIALYMLGHAGVKAALFACAGVLLDRYGSVDEYGLYRKARELRWTGGLFGLAGLALAGLPPFGTGLGKAVAEEAAGTWHPWLPALFVLVSAATAGAVLRVWLRVFAGAGPPPRGAGPEAAEETAGEGEEPETGRRLRRVPEPMLTVPAALLAAALAVGVWPGLAAGVGHAAHVFVDRRGYLDAVIAHRQQPPPPGRAPHWTAAGVALDLLSLALAAGCAALAVHRPARALRGRAGRLARALPATGRRLLAPVRHLHSGHVGDYVAWTMLGMALLAALAAPGTLG
jgi:multicomponent Na+:H+ antiporter subunit D